MNNIIIKQATKADIPLIEDILLDAVNWLESINQPLWTKERVSWKGLKEFSPDDFYIAFWNNKPAGCMAVIEHDPYIWPQIKKGESLFVHKLAVKRFAAGRGISTALLDFAVDKCQERNIKILRLDTDATRPKVMKFYEDFGFICVDKKTLYFDKEYYIAFYVYDISDIKNQTINHYDSLIDENNDPFKDSFELQEYMNKWDGEKFIEELKLEKNKNVLEIGVGTGRLAQKICCKCNSFTGIDFSSKTINQAKENLKNFNNINLICADFLEYNFDFKFDIIYSSLTFLHIKNQDKAIFIQKISDLLNENGRFILSIDKNQQKEIIYNNRKIPVFPDNPNKTEKFILNAGLIIENKFETEFAVIFTAVKK